MNFVGHAHVARAVRDDAELALGAMLPDFASMARTRLERVDRPVLAEGVALHHRTDDAFHACPAFLDLCVRTSTDLEERGVPWGAARAVAHVGTEMLLDGILLEDRAVRAIADDAIALLAAPGLAATVGARHAERWATLLERVRGRGVPDFYGDPEAVADRLIAILAPRPRLAVPEAHRPTLRTAMLALRPEVERSAGAMVAAARTGSDPVVDRSAIR